MTFTTTLNKALNVSDTEYVDGAEVEKYYYPGADLDDTVCLELANEESETFYLQQEIEVNSKGIATVLSVEGIGHRILFEISRPLVARDMEGNE